MSISPQIFRNSRLLHQYMKQLPRELKYTRIPVNKSSSGGTDTSKLPIAVRITIFGPWKTKYKTPTAITIFAIFISLCKRLTDWAVWNKFSGFTLLFSFLILWEVMLNVSAYKTVPINDWTTIINTVTLPETVLNKENLPRQPLLLSSTAIQMPSRHNRTQLIPIRVP